MAPDIVTNADDAAERLTAEHQAVFESLMKLEDHPVCRLLKSTAPDGVTHERQAEVRTGLATLWTLYQTYRAAVLRVRAIRARRSQPSRADLKEIEELVSGAATVALPSPDGSSQRHGRQLTLDELVAEFRTAYAKVYAVVSAVDVEQRTPRGEATDPEPSVLDELRSHAPLRLDLVEETLAEAARLQQQARDERLRAYAKIHGLPVPELAVPAGDPPGSRLIAARELCQRGGWRQLATELAALERDADAMLQRARTELADSSRPLRERDELRGRLGAYRAKAAALGRVEDLGLEQRYQRARDLLWSAPCDLAIAAVAVAEFQNAVNATAADGDDK